MDTPVDWWRTFFEGAIVDLWLRTPTAEQTGQEVTFLQEELQVPPPARLLDVPCGGGRHSRELARRGYDMTGVDLSAGFLDAARSEATEGPGAIDWEPREMRDLPWPGRFDGAFSFGNSFGYLDDEGNAEFLNSVARTLKPGARYVLETGYVAECLLPVLQARAWYRVGDILMLADRRYDHVEGRLHVDYTLIRDGKVVTRPMSARLYTYREILRLLDEAGFGDVRGYGSLAREPFKLGSSNLLLTARKK
jgi:SAM-dependent methyltransferase